MFQVAYRHARQFTLPLVLSMHHVDNRCTSSIGTCIAVNRDGWIVTALHIFESFFAAALQKRALEERERSKAEIGRDPRLSQNERRKRLKALGFPKPTDVSDVSLWPGRDGVNIVDIAGIREIDLAWGRMVPFDSSWIPEYPVFQDLPESAERAGTSLCRLGFPFHDITPTFDSSTRSFTLPPASFPLPLFPIEGMYTRNLILDSVVPQSEIASYSMVCTNFRMLGRCLSTWV